MNDLNSLSACRMKWLAVLAGAFFMASAAGVCAAQNARPCAEDVARLCQGIKPTGGKVLKCLNEHTSELSPACKDNMATINDRITKMKAKIQDFAEACNNDVKNLCPVTKPGGGRIVRCLRQHESGLSPACKDKLGKPGGRGGRQS